MNIEERVREIMQRAGLDDTDPDVVAVLSDPCDFVEFNRRVDFLRAAPKAASKSCALGCGNDATPNGYLCGECRGSR